MKTSNKFIVYVLLLLPLKIASMEMDIPLSLVNKDTVYLLYTASDLRTVSTFLRTCKTYHNLYNTVPKGIKTKEEWASQQFGINRLLHETPLLCTSLASHEYINTLVHYARTHNKFMFKYMLMHESSVNHKVLRSILDQLGYNKKEHRKTKNKIAAFKARSKNKITLVDAIKNKQQELARIFILNKAYDQKLLLLHDIIKHNLTNLIALAISKTTNINATNTRGQTALHIAAQKGNIPAIELLLSNHANSNKIDSKKEFALDYAIRNNHPSAIKILSHPMPQSTHTRQWNLFHFICFHGVSITTYIALHNILDTTQINGINSDRWTPLHLAVFNGHTSLIPLLLADGANINAQTNKGKTPLHLAFIKKYQDVAEVLIAHGADITIKNNKGHKALDACFQETSLSTSSSEEITSDSDESSFTSS